MHVCQTNHHFAQAEPLLKSNCHGLTLLNRGKVKDVYDLGDALLLISTDRISVAGVSIAEGFAGKGRLVNQLSAHWFRKLRGSCPNHLISATPRCFPGGIDRYPEVLDGRAMLVYKTLPLPVRCVVRGYLAGGAWREYQETGAICGNKLPAGMMQSQRLPAPIFAPTLKGGAGELSDTVEFRSLQRLLGDSLADQLRDASLSLYFRAWKSARERGVLIADTKFEFGLHDGKLMLIDECLTPDNSRFWAVESYRPGGPIPALGKQLLAEFLDPGGFPGTLPDLPQDLLCRIGEKYHEAYRRIVGKRCG